MHILVLHNTKYVKIISAKTNVCPSSSLKISCTVFKIVGCVHNGYNIYKPEIYFPI